MSINPVLPPQFFEWTPVQVSGANFHSVDKVSFDLRYGANRDAVLKIQTSPGNYDIRNLEDEPIAIWMHTAPPAPPPPVHRNVYFGRFVSLHPQNPCDPPRTPPCDACPDCLERSSGASIMPLNSSTAPTFSIQPQNLVLSTGMTRTVYTGIGLGDIRDCRLSSTGRCQGKLFHYIETLPLEISVIRDGSDRFIRFRYPTPYYPYEIRR